jgi:O-methyltransferase involved in polyketide biosynthesis
MVAASALDRDWLPAVRERAGPYFFSIEGVLSYLDQAPQVIARIAEEFPGALIVFDTYTQRMLEQQHKQAARKGMEALWAWSCDDPHALESLGLDVVSEAAVTLFRSRSR